jgi:predicted ATPase
MIIGTYRPVEMLSEGHPLKTVTQELYGHGLGTELALGVLSEAEIESYLAMRLQVPSPLRGEGQGEGDGQAYPQHLARTLHQRTGGNPLFLVAMVEDLVNRGVVTQTNEGWTLQDNGKALGIPESIRHLVARQRERLPPEEQRLLEAASVAGMEFSAAAVAAALESETAVIEQRCERLAERQHFAASRSRGMARRHAGGALYFSACAVSTALA